MTQETTTDISDVLLEVSKTIKEIGINETISFLKTSREKFKILSEEQKLKAKSIIQIVCDEFGIDYSDFFSRTRKNNRRYAIGICANILKEKLGIDNTDSAFLLKKPENLVTLYRNEINELNENLKSDIVIIQKIKEINLKLKYL